MYTFNNFHKTGCVEQEPEKSDDDKKEDEEDEEQENDIEEEEKETAKENEDMQSRGQIRQLQLEVSKWREQSEWLFLSYGNRGIKKPGAVWSTFFEEVSGQKSTIEVWRKVVETHSHHTNTREQQERLSEALLHQHRTGKDYYVSEDINEAADATMKVWDTVTTPSPSIPSLQSDSSFIISPNPSFSNLPPIILTPTQKNYFPYPGDWQCNYCDNVNFARRNECKRCARPKPK